MKFTLAWLKEHLETDAPLDEVLVKLTAVGLEVEGVADKSAALAPFKSVHVISAEQHPNAERLRVCQVDTGNGIIQVVCGAPNARTGMKAVFAPSGTTVPGSGLVLKPTNIRGVESNGMLVSEREMGLSDEHNGIIELAADAPLGVPFARLLGLDDPTIEIKLTPNRGDCLGVYGIARDLAAGGLGRLKPLSSAPVPGTFKSPIGVTLNFPVDAANACPYFVGRYVRGVKNGPSPAWLQARLRAIGLRPISALVDITNFITFDLCRPLHVFDADKVAGNIEARLARPGEKMLALDGKEYELAEGMTVIADGAGPEALGGVMGGEHSGCTPETVNVFIEAAIFDPVRTAMTGRRLGINSDARYRFERGVDPAFVQAGMEIATRLVIELCGGTPSELIIAGAEPKWQRSINFRTTRTATLGGIDIPVETQVNLLRGLGFTVEAAGDTLKVAPPSWRPDIEGEPDLVEEIVRLYGYDEIPQIALPPLTAVAKPALNAQQRRGRLVKRALAAQGLVEAVTYSFIPRAHAELFGGGDPSLLLANPISADLDAMRPSILPSLVAAAKRNADRGSADVALFEVGPQYADDTPNGQSLVAATLRAGQSGPRHWSAKPRAVDAFDAKADALAALAAIGAPVDQLMVMGEAPSWFHPGRSGTLRLGPKTILAAFGELHPRIVEAMDAKGPLVGAEIYPERLPAPKSKGKAKPALNASDLQPVERDFAFLLDSQVAAEAVVKAARSVDRVLISQVSVFDLFEGPSLGGGKKSLAIAVRLAPRDKTLTEAEIDAIGQKIVAAVTKATGGTLRG